MRKRKLRTISLWIFWVLLVQFVLINISAAFYADKLTHLRLQPDERNGEPVSQNIFVNTWQLFTGPTLYKHPLINTPGFAYSTIFLKAKDDITIEAWLSKTDSVSKGTVVLIHGLTGNKGMVIDEANAFREFGFNVMLIDLRSHGKSGGAVTSMGFKESEEVGLAYDYLKQAGEKKIYLWGASMGAVAVLKAVADYHLEPSAIIIEMPFLSLKSHMESKSHYLGFPKEPFGFLISFWTGVEQGFNGLGANTARYAPKVNCPVLMQYGEKDGLVMQYETRTIYEAISSSNKKLVTYENAGHESFLKNDPATWKREVSGFLK